MKTPFKNWDEKLREKMNDYESPVSDDLFKTVMKKREHRKWIAAFRKRSRNLWLLLFLLIPFTCTYLNNRAPQVTENNTVQKEDATGTDQSLTAATTPVESANSISPDHSTSSSVSKKDNFNGNEKYYKKQPVKNQASTIEQPMNNFSSETVTSGGFYNTSRSVEKKSSTSQQDNLLAVTKNDVSLPPEVIDKNSTVSMSYQEKSFISSLPLNMYNISHENHSLPVINSIAKINASKTLNQTNDSSAEIEISPTSWNLNWSVEAFFSPDLSFQQLTDDANDSLTLTDWNKHMEKSFTTGLRFSLNLDGDLFLKSGITYSKEQSSFTLQKTWKVPVILDSTYYYTIWHPFEDPTFVFYSDTIITSKDSVADYASSVTYSYWNIPLLVGYTFDLNKFRIGVQSGVVFNAQFTNKGSSIDPQTLEPVTLPEGNTSFFHDRASLSFYAGVENEYRLNEHFGIFAEPYFQMQFKPITGDAAPVEQLLHKFGVNAGIKFSF